MRRAAMSASPSVGVRRIEDEHRLRPAQVPTIRSGGSRSGCRGSERSDAHREEDRTKRSLRWCRHRQESPEKRALD